MLCYSQGVRKLDFDLQLAIRCVDAFSQASGLGCALKQSDGQILHTAGHSCVQCKMCELAGKEGNVCRATQQYGMQSAERFGGKYIYFCSMGLTCFTSPILGPHGSVAQLIVGPFMMVDLADYIAYDLIEGANVQREKIPTLTHAAAEIPYVAAPRVSALSELLFMSVAFMNNVSEANRMMETEKSCLMQGQISDYIHRFKSDANPSPYPYRMERQFLLSLAKGEQASAQKQLNELLGHIIFSTGGDIATIQDRAYDLLLLISRTAMDSGADPDYIEGHLQRFRRKMKNVQSVDELCQTLSQVVRVFMDDMFSNRNAKYTDLVHRCIQFLQKHYSEKITLEDVARSVYMSPTYLSRVFKRETGTSLVDFLNRIRIEKSKEMLTNNDVRLIDVALQCGFESQSYFNRVFKQSTGMTPQQYRKNIEYI